MGTGARTSPAGVTPAFRPAAPADIDVITALEAETFTDPWSARALLDSMRTPGVVFLVTEEAGKVVGYVVTRRIGDEAEILNLAVAPANRRRGLGQALLSRALSEVERAGVRDVFLEVRSSNDAARALYAAAGFAEVGRRADYYRRPTEDGIILRKKL